MPFALLLAVTALSVVVLAEEDGPHCLVQARVGRSRHVQRSRTSISTRELVDAEARFTTTRGEADHGDVGGDRMSERRHNYAPTYSKHLTSLLAEAEVSTVAEVGILTGSGLAMWSALFPASRVFGFDKNTSSYHNNLDHMRSLGFEDGPVKVTEMDQMQDNVELLRSVFGGLRPNIVVDDGYHVPEAASRTFASMRPHLAERFVYFIEDLIAQDVDAGQWEIVRTHVSRDCSSCKFAIECPPVSDKKECVAVIHNLQDLVQTSVSLGAVDYSTVKVPRPWEAGEQPLARCPAAGASAPPRGRGAEAHLEEALAIFCQAGLGSLAEFYVDPRFKGNYERLKGLDGWIEKAYLTYVGLHAGPDKFSAEEDLLVQSVHHFSKYPVVLTNFGTHMPQHANPERFPNLVVVHARQSADAIGRDFNFNKLSSMLFTKVKGGVVLDADEWVSHGVDAVMEHAFKGTTEDYPYPVMPVHWMSRDPESSDMEDLNALYGNHFSFRFVSSEGPRRTMRWGHAHPTWTHYALPWLARWTSYVLAPKEAGAPAWLTQQGSRYVVSDEDLLNMASWADGLDRQWCKFEVPQSNWFDNYLGQRDFYSPADRKMLPNDVTRETKRFLGMDSKYFPKGIPLMFRTSHDGKEPQNSHRWLSRLWQRDQFPSKTIYYDGKWFESGKAVKEYDPLLKCMAF